MEIWPVPFSILRSDDLQGGLHAMNNSWWGIQMSLINSHNRTLATQRRTLLERPTWGSYFRSPLSLFYHSWSFRFLELGNWSFWFWGRRRLNGVEAAGTEFCLLSISCVQRKRGGAVTGVAGGGGGWKGEEASPPGVWHVLTLSAYYVREFTYGGCPLVKCGAQWMSWSSGIYWRLR